MIREKIYLDVQQHAADMGIELHKAESLKYGFKYIQDKDLTNNFILYLKNNTEIYGGKSVRNSLAVPATVKRRSATQYSPLLKRPGKV